jgi:hypothetical protein
VQLVKFHKLVKGNEALLKKIEQKSQEMEVKLPHHKEHIGEVYVPVHTNVQAQGRLSSRPSTAPVSSKVQKMLDSLGLLQQKQTAKGGRKV